MKDLSIGKQTLSIQIIYCVESGYLEMASSLSARITNEFESSVNLVQGHGGIFSR